MWKVNKNVKNRKKQLTFWLPYTIIQHVERQTTDALLAQLVEHLTLNQGVQGSSPWRRIESTGFEDTGASGLVLFCAVKTGNRNNQDGSKILWMRLGFADVRNP